MNNTGCYECKDCNIKIKVLTLSHHRSLIYPKKIKKCPHCKSDNIEFISKSEFKKYESNLNVDVKRKNIEFNIKC
jgi:Zn finger protein HypA/HybF involved in hydrogenase expression